ncbi:MAG: lytic murein transglycosylase [SAR324 cluster bacterium]|nr:lytic murein transglycosylase [SAR324 cluster bacterium]
MKNLITFLILAFLVTPAFAGEEKARSFYSQEKSHLVDVFESQGFDKNELITIFYDSRLKKRPVATKKNLHTKETGRDYKDFSSPYSIWMAKKFQKKWRTTLDKASKKFDVDKEAIVAIILVETGFGNVMGKYPVISVFSSIIVEHKNRQEQYKIIDSLSEEEQYHLSRLAKKAAWAEVELNALLTMAKQGNISPYKFKGSYAGAFGLPQFLPSSYLKWGYDSDKNGSVNLFLVPDALYSTANYLKKHGWEKGIHKRANHEAVYAYNHSRPYVSAVLKVAKILKRHNTHRKNSLERNSLASLKSEKNH